MEDIENKVIKYLYNQEEIKSIDEIETAIGFDDCKDLHISKSLVELFLSNVIKRKIINGIAYYYIKNEKGE